MFQGNLHPVLRRSFNFLKGYFEDIVINEQDLLSEEKHMKKFIDFLPDVSVKTKVQEAWNREKGNSSSKWSTWLRLY